MGLQVNTGIVNLLKEGLRNSFKDKSVLMLGKQDMYITIDELYTISEKLKYKLDDINEVKVDKLGNIDSYSFFKLIGFAKVEAMDVSDYEDASIVYDLNKDKLSNELIGKFDYIIDGGTFEHLFNIQNAFKNVIQMLKVGGKIFHYVTANNYIDHGFYSFSPTLYIEYYNANNFIIEDASLIYLSEDPYNSLTTKVDCRLIDFINKYQCMVKKDYETLFQCIVEKKEESTFDQIPIQRKFFVEAEKMERARERLLNTVKNNNNKSLAIYGTGEMAKKLIDYLKDKNDGSIEKIFGFVDKTRIGNHIEGFKVYSVDEIIEYDINAICIASSNWEMEVYYRIKYLEEKGIKIIKLVN